MAFPTSPTNGQQANINGITYTYSNTVTAWTVSTSVSNTFVSINVSDNVNSGNLLATGLISATGNVSGGNLVVTGNIIDTGALTIVTGSNGNITLSPNGTGIVAATGAISTTGNISANNATFTSNQTLSYGTANGVIYLNSNKVATSGTALVFDGTNLGVGTSSPAAKLDAFQSSVGTYFLGGGGDNKVRQLAITSSTTTNSGDTHTFDAQSGTGVLAFATVSVEKARIDTSGNLIVGATATRGTYKLDIRSDTSIALGSNATYYGTIGYSAGTGLLSLATESSGGINFLSGATERARIDSSGNLLVGTTSKLGGGVDGLDLNTAAETGITFGKSGVVKNYFYLNTDAASFRWQTASGTTADVVSNTNGVTLANGGTSWGSLSDERKKDIIEPITDATTKVSSLRAVIGKYKTEEDGIRRAMLIAQDVQAVLPEAVTENADGNLILQYTDTIPLLVAAIQEQQALIAQLTARITALEGA